jgi:hypothetical protein
MARFEAPLTVRSLLVFTQDMPVSAAGLDYGIKRRDAYRI